MKKLMAEYHSRLILLFLFFAFCLPLSASAETQSKGQLKQQELNQLRQDISALKKQLKQQQSEKSELEQDIQKSEQSIANNARQLFSTQQQIAELNHQLSTLNNNLAQNNRQLITQQQLLSGQLQASYAIGRQEYIKLLLNQQDPATISRIMTYYDYFNEARSQQINKVNTLLQAIVQEKQKISLLSQTLQDKQYQLQQEQRAMQTKQAERSALVTLLNQDIVSKDKQLANLNKNKKNLTRLINKLKKALDDIPSLPTDQPFAKKRGKLYWPAKGKVKKLYDHWRSVGKVKWQGNIISGKEGTPVHTISNGRIAYSDWLRGYGLITIIDHGDGYMSLYGHNQTLLKEVGDWVENNEIIATIGNSGGIKRVGLYFEVRYNGKPSDPSLWCKKRRI
ncbi:murein hydrolase activator EnvC family protein [sulfur-oxidizing endosymbiont of Gigantopelta aegis]|uniref:murein hydrolase activator EnvC family protein n=1 Tax=sulfur-oxidizing endosymbiont of Gigantopelta aegis TaxID=2794934 RepID=UPI0018DD578F|nr:peptidoglycan DD-metalloendopeptidase family protein [sulfur-oxidizing endosymbiont of Gigantopelta aegis]